MLPFSSCINKVFECVMFCRPLVRDTMRSSCVLLMLLAVQLINAEPDSGTVIPAESKIFMKKFSFSHCSVCLSACVHA